MNTTLVKTTLTWTCCFCGGSVGESESVLLVAILPADCGEQQFRTHPACLIKCLHPSVPLHPELDPD
jgi:hypothetical protein